MQFSKVGIIGVGLIGGSLARALKAHKVCSEVIGYGQTKSSLLRANELGIIDKIAPDMQTAIQNVDLIVVAVPVGSMKSVFNQFVNRLDEKTIITDVGSTKQSVVRDISSAFGNTPQMFVPGHPIAGTENRGVDATDANLFKNRCVILTPNSNTNRQALTAVREMWQAVGADVVEMDLQHHDQVLAATSHVCHLAAFTLVDTLAKAQAKHEIFKYAAGGFRDFTRIAASDPKMWHDIFFANKNNVVNMLDQYIADLTTMREALTDDNKKELMVVLENAKKTRDTYSSSMDSDISDINGT